MSIKDTARTIVCYGDSNTWGAIPKSDDRLPRSVCWPSVLQKLLGDDYEVINEGLSGRTLVAHDPANPHRTGITHLASILRTHEPIGMFIIMLGTNDINSRHNLEAKDISDHLAKTIKFIQVEQERSKTKFEILVICPPTPVQPDNGKIDEGMKKWPEIYQQLPRLFKEVAEKNDCIFMNAGDYITSSKVDGYHLDAESHIKLAEAIGRIVKDRLKN